MPNDSQNKIVPIDQLTGKNTITFSEKIPSVPQKVADKIQASLTKNAVVNTATGETGVKAKALTTILNTNPEGARFFLMAQPKNNLFENNKGETFVKTPALIAETSKQAEEPRPATQREYLRQSRNFLTDISDSSVADRSRDHHLKQLEAQMKVEKKNVKAQAIEEGKLDPSKPIDVHHIEPVSSSPRKMADPTNLAAISRDDHQEWHNQGGGTKEEWEQFKKLKKIK